MSQIQVRIDDDTKQKAKKILNDAGLDISTAVKVLFKQIVNSNSFPVELRDKNGFRRSKANELEEAMATTNRSKTFKSSKELFNDLEI